MKRQIQAATMALALAAATGCLVTTPAETQAATKKIAINKKNFPDRVFREIVKANYDKNKDNKLSAAEIKKATKFGSGSGFKSKVKYKTSKYGKYQTHYISEIKNFKGIEKFTNLRKLVADGTKATKINLTKCKKLTYISMQDSRLTSLDLNKCKSMKYVYMQGNPLKTIKINKCKKLLWVDIEGSYVKNLKINRNKKTEVIGDEYYKPFTVATIRNTFVDDADVTRRAYFGTLDANNNYAVYQWQNNNSTCSKYTLVNGKFVVSNVAICEEVKNKLASVNQITGQWEDNSGNFYILADQYGSLNRESSIIIYKLDARGNILGQVDLAKEIEKFEGGFTAEFMQRDGKYAYLRMSANYDSNAKSPYAVIVFNMETMKAEKEAYCQYRPATASENIVVQQEYQGDSTVYAGQIANGQEVENQNGGKIQVNEKTAVHTISIKDSWALNRRYQHNCYIYNNSLYILGPCGLYKAKFSDNMVKKVYTTSTFSNLYTEVTNGIYTYSFVMKSENDIITAAYSYSDNKYTYQNGVVK